MALTKQWISGKVMRKVSKIYETNNIKKKKAHVTTLKVYKKKVLKEYTTGINQGNTNNHKKLPWIIICKQIA